MPPAIARTDSESSFTTEIRFPSVPSSLRSRNPCSVVRITVSRESVIEASMPASVSLSPNFSSLTDTESFSFTIGNTPASQIAFTQFITFK